MPRISRTKQPAISSPPPCAASQLPPSDAHPAQLYILPSNVSLDSRIVLLPHPATQILCRYLYCPVTGFYELTSIAVPTTKPSSCLLVPDRKARAETRKDLDDQGYLIEDAKMLVATPFDPMFFLTPLFDSNTESRPVARPLDDQIQSLEMSSRHVSTFLRQPAQRQAFEQLIKGTLCGAGEVDGEPLLRADAACLFKPMKQKAQRMTQKGLPKSLAAYSTKQLQVPSLRPLGLSAEGVKHGVKTDNDTAAVVSEHPEANTISAPVDSMPTQEVLNLHAFRISLAYLTHNYLPRRLHAPFQSFISQHSKINFTPLDEHLTHVQQVKQEAQALRSLSDNISRKRSSMEDDEAAEARVEKRRKKEEEEKRKKAESRAAKQLKKVDTSGMKKMSLFFAKSAAVK